MLGDVYFTSLGFMLFGAGLTVGFSNLFCGVCVGIVGRYSETPLMQPLLGHKIMVIITIYGHTKGIFQDCH